MWLLRELLKQTRILLLPVGILLGLTYVYYHLFTGDRSLWVWYGLKEQVTQMQIENTLLKEKQTALEDKVKRLKPDSLDVDYLDERVRETLPVLRSNERVIYLSR